MRSDRRAAVLFIAVAPAEDELLFHQELLTLAVTHPKFRYLPLVAAEETSRVSTSCVSCSGR